MARGLPAFWSTVVALPFFVGGYLLATTGGQYPPELGQVFVLFGAFIMVLGLYVHFVAAPSPPDLAPSENLLATQHPSQRVAAVKIALGLPFLLAGIYLLHFTMRPYVQPTLALVVGLYLVTTGVYTYWTNSLTTYYVTDQRVVRSYRFLSRITEEVPFDKVRGVAERRSFGETLVGLGNVAVTTGVGDGLTIRLRNVENSNRLAKIVRQRTRRS